MDDYSPAKSYAQWIRGRCQASNCTIREAALALGELVSDRMMVKQAELIAYRTQELERRGQDDAEHQ